MTTKLFESLFPELGLTEEHARVYLAAVENGPSPASLLAKKAKVVRSTCYQLLTDLIEKGLMSAIKEETKKVFTPTSPETVQELLFEKETNLRKQLVELSAEMSKLKTIFESQKPQFPKVSFYEGERGLKMVYYDALSADEILVVCQGSPQKQTSLADDPAYLKDFIRESIDRQIPTRELLEDNPAVREYQQKYQNKIHQIIITPRNPAISFGHVDKHIYQGKIAYISHDHLVGVIVEDETLYLAEKAQFEVLWKHYEKMRL